MNEIVENLAKAAGYSAGAYGILLTGGSVLEALFSHRIRSHEQLDAVLDEEAGKLEGDESSLGAKFYSNRDRGFNKIRGARSSKSGFDLENDIFLSLDAVNGSTIVPVDLIEIKQGWGASIGAVRHELYHLSKHFPRGGGFGGFLKYWLYEEPTAILYATTGLKL